VGSRAHCLLFSTCFFSFAAQCSALLQYGADPSVNRFSLPWDYQPIRLSLSQAFLCAVLDPQFKNWECQHAWLNDEQVNENRMELCSSTLMPDGSPESPTHIPSPGLSLGVTRGALSVRQACLPASFHVQKSP
jgi:hypothetical protein